MRRVKRIWVRGLFGVFDHDIPLNQEDRITIIHGPNGYGKTTLLNMVADLIAFRLAIFRDIPLTQFGIELDNGGYLKVSKIEHFSRELKITFKGNEAKAEPSLTSKHPTESGATLGTTGDLPTWAINLQKVIGVRYIDTQRLLDKSRPRVDISTVAISLYAQRLAKKIQSVLTDYAELAQQLDRSFPNRLMDVSSPLDVGTIRERLNTMEEKRATLVALGLLDEAGDVAAINKSHVDKFEQQRAVFTVYLNDVEAKLRVFDDLAQRIGVLRTIIAQRFLHKTMKISRDQDISFFAGGTLIPLDSLSSGEQHELVLLCTMLFEIPSGTLILIDEPELSLHVVWQQDFLSDLQSIIDVSQVDVLMATHSPSIIGSRWDLTVELKGPEYAAIPQT